MNSLRKLISVNLLLLIAFSLIGCSSLSINTKKFEQNNPRAIGVIVGYDVSAKRSLSTGQEVLVAVTFGLPGAIYASASAENESITFIEQINEQITNKIIKELQGKGYSATLLKQQPNEWSLLESIRDKDGVYQSLLSKYGLDNVSDYDALFFYEYLCIGRYEGYLWSKEEANSLKINEMKLKYLKSKIMVYDTKDFQRLYFDMVQEGYSSSSKHRFNDQLDVIVPLDKFPKAK